MSTRSGEEPGGVEATFAEFLAARDEDPGLDFEVWVRAHAGRAGELRALHDALRRLQPYLPESSSRGPSGGAPDPVGASLARGHEILEQLGAGAFGHVFRAHDQLLQRDVALKVLNDDARISEAVRRRFLDEARVLARLDHPNIVRIHSIESEGGEVRLSLELVPGRTLEQIVEQEGPFAPEEAARIGAELCRALAAIHGAGLVHMDVKPSNVMRATGGRIVLLDFGFARSVDERAGAGGSPVGGTPPFMSPEHFAGRAPGPRSDLYSLGVLLYWLLAGRPPYEFDGFADLSEKVQQGRHVPLLDVRPDVPPELAAVVEHAMAHEEGARYASAGEMEAALRRFAAGRAPARAADGGGRAAPRPTARRALLVTALAAAVAAAFWIVPRVAAEPRFELEQRFFRRLDGGGEEPIAEGASVRVGDRLFLRARANQAFYLYLFNQDDRGNWFRLLPRGDVPQLREPGTWLELPSPTGSWQVNLEATEENFYWIASPSRVAFADELASIVPATGPARGELEEEARARLRGSVRGVGVETGPLDPEQEPFDLAGWFEVFTGHLASTDRVVAEHLRLRNEGL